MMGKSVSRVPLETRKVIWLLGRADFDLDRKSGGLNQAHSSKLNFPPPRKEPSMPKTPNILVIDDDRYDNDRYCQLLRSAGHEVQSLTTAEQALQIIAQQRFDVV